MKHFEDLMQRLASYNAIAAECRYEYGCAVLRYRTATHEGEIMLGEAFPLKDE